MPFNPNLLILIVVAVIVVGFVLLKNRGRVAGSEAEELLKQGALVIDVRSEGEYQGRHLPGAINIPLDRLQSEIAKHAPDKAKPLLLHCASGMRSGVGAGKLQGLGYQHVFNLGSYSQAEAVLAARKP